MTSHTRSRNHATRHLRPLVWRECRLIYTNYLLRIKTRLSSPNECEQSGALILRGSFSSGSKILWMNTRLLWCIVLGWFGCCKTATNLDSIINPCLDYTIDYALARNRVVNLVRVECAPGRGLGGDRSFIRPDGRGGQHDQTRQATNVYYFCICREIDHQVMITRGSVHSSKTPTTTRAIQI